MATPVTPSALTRSSEHTIRVMSSSNEINEPVRETDLEGQHGGATGQNLSQQTVPDIPLTLEQFRALVGIPQNAGAPSGRKEEHRPGGTTINGPLNSASSGNAMPDSNIPPLIQPATIKASTTTRRSVLVLFRLLPRPKYVRRWRQPTATTAISEEDEYATSLYYSLVREESDQWRLFHIYNVVTYASLVLQLVIASALIIIGAIPSKTTASGSADTYRAHRISVAVLGAFTGLLTGIMSLLKGQGLPLRFLQYASRLRQVRDKIEFMERTLRANILGVVVTHQDVLDIWHEFENVINERDMNRPDAWASTSVSTSSKDGAIDRMWRGQTLATLNTSTNRPGGTPFEAERGNDNIFRSRA
ncbi:hypothetical protein LTR24_006601 [Lithohypha guttulata]|uniref:SMODS and SLOG-associating 2TM effector domain-containing protein n=1 Tax=Lithohypha guttulata TaxID=1690604 RepID=A0ABR0K5G9_9EURO|nr:hypothetical protein LTR24_006601 [Lithohypha guttulata]